MALEDGRCLGQWRRRAAGVLPRTISQYKQPNGSQEPFGLFDRVRNLTFEGFTYGATIWSI